MLKSRFVGLAALTLAACSGGGDDSANEAGTGASEPAAPATSAAQTPTGLPSPAAEPAVEPSASPIPTPTPTVTPTAAAAAAAAPTKLVTAAPPAAYARCVVCHTAEKGGEDKLGPNLFGTYGSAAAQGSFAYSEALKGSGITWTDDNLHKWLENPRAMVPGNRMSFPGLKDAAKRQEIIDYLKKQR